MDEHHTSMKSDASDEVVYAWQSHAQLGGEKQEYSEGLVGKGSVPDASWAERSLFCRT